MQSQTASTLRIILYTQSKDLFNLVKYMHVWVTAYVCRQPQISEESFMPVALSEEQQVAIEFGVSAPQHASY